jgi:hypothetical protein
MVAIRSFGLTGVGGGAVSGTGRLHEDKIRIYNREKYTIFFMGIPHDNFMVISLSIAENPLRRRQFHEGPSGISVVNSRIWDCHDNPKSGDILRQIPLNLHESGARINQIIVCDGQVSVEIPGI